MRCAKLSLFSLCSAVPFARVQNGSRDQVQKIKSDNGVADHGRRAGLALNSARPFRADPGLKVRSALRESSHVYLGLVAGPWFARAIASSLLAQ